MEGDGSGGWWWWGGGVPWAETRKSAKMARNETFVIIAIFGDGFLRWKLELGSLEPVIWFGLSICR